MADDIDSVIAAEREKMHAFADETQRFMSDLSQRIQGEFTGALNRMVSEELPKFTRQVEQAFSSLGLSQAGESVSGLVGDALGIALGGNSGNAFAAALDAALTSALGSALRTGKVDATSVLRAGYNAGGRSINKGIRLSRLQATVGNALELERSRRGL